VTVLYRRSLTYPVPLRERASADRPLSSPAFAGEDEEKWDAPLCLHTTHLLLCNAQLIFFPEFLRKFSQAFGAAEASAVADVDDENRVVDTGV
jgi:hypothetical protein